MRNNTQDLIIIGGGIMGLFTAYYASQFGKKITILEKLTIPNKKAASYSFTRSIRSDYPDPLYTKLSYEAQKLWRKLQAKSDKKFYFDCGCLNIAKKTLTPDYSQTYAGLGLAARKSLKLETIKLSRNDLQTQFPQFDADFGHLDTKGGFLYLPIITNLLLKLLKEKTVTIEENTVTTSIEEKNNTVSVSTNKRIFSGKKLVITSGLWTNDVVKLIKNNKLTFPINPDQPKEKKYYYPSKELLDKFSPEHLPVFAYLDFGIYGHPIFDKKKGAVKIGYYHPFDIQKKSNPQIKSVSDFVNECLPLLKDVRSENVKDADQCSYDLVDDDDFILGRLPSFENIFVGTGWRGTGYKFAPLIGKILMQFVLQKDTVYDISRFSPERFIKI